MPAKNYANLAPEGTYGTPPSSGWQGLVVREDAHKVNVDMAYPVGIFYGQEGQTDEGLTVTQVGAEGTLKPYMPSTGIGLLLKALFGAPTTTTLDTGAYQHVFTTGSNASTVSLATQIGRTFKDGTADRDTYAGAMAKEWRIDQAKRPASGGQGDESLAKMEVDFDYQRMIAPGDFTQKLPTYPTPELYHGAGAGFDVSIGSSLGSLSSKCLTSVSFKYMVGLDIEDTCVSTVLKSKPTRGQEPEASLDGEWSYAARDAYDAFVAGTPLAARLAWTGTATATEIADGIQPSLTIDIARFVYTGETPEMSRDAKTKQKLPMKVLKTSGEPLLTVTYVSSETFS